MMYQATGENRGTNRSQHQSLGASEIKMSCAETGREVTLRAVIRMAIKGRFMVNPPRCRCSSGHRELRWPHLPSRDDVNKTILDPEDPNAYDLLLQRCRTPPRWPNCSGRRAAS